MGHFLAETMAVGVDQMAHALLQLGQPGPRTCHKTFVRCHVIGLSDLDENPAHALDSAEVSLENGCNQSLHAFSVGPY